MKSTRIFIADANGIWIDWESVLPGFSVRGQSMILRGGAGADSVYVGNATVVNATALGGGADRIYLQGYFADYTISFSGSRYTVRGTGNGRTEEVTINVNSDGDRLYFANGYIVTDFATLQSGGNFVNMTSAMLVTGAGNVTPAFPAPVPVQGSSPTTVFTDPEGVNLPAFRAGSRVVVRGGAGVDSVYVANATVVNAAALGGGADRIYLQGYFADYTISFSGSRYTIKGTGNGRTEEVALIANADGDRLYFADGYIVTDLATLRPGGIFVNMTASMLNTTERTPGVPAPGVSTDQRAFKGMYSDTLAWHLPVGLDVADASAALYSGSVRVQGGTLSGTASVTSVKVLGPDGAARNLGTGPSFEPVYPDSLSLDTGGVSQRIQGTFVRLNLSPGGGGVLPSFSGFTHLGTALQPDAAQPTYKATLAGTDWYLWQPQGWLGRYVLSTDTASAGWWVSGNSNGLGTGTLAREGVLRSGHWFYNHGTLNAWDTMFQTYWGLFDLRGTGTATDWALSLGQGHAVQPGDRLQITTTTGGVATETLVELPRDMTRPTLGAATITATDATGQALSPSQVLGVGDVVRISVAVSEPLVIQTIVSPQESGQSRAWPGLDNAVIALDIGGVSRSAGLNLAASRQANGQQLVFEYTIANGDVDASGGLRVGAIDTRFTRIDDASGNRLWTQGLDVAEVDNLWQVAGSSQALSQQPVHVQALVGGAHWPDSTPASGRQGDAVTELNYVFLQSWPGYFLNPSTGEVEGLVYAESQTTVFQPWTAEMRSLLQNQVLAALSTYANLRFTEVSDPAQAHLAMGSYAMIDGIGGFGFYPPTDASAPLGDSFGDLWINSNADLSGAWIRYAIAHEIGHTLGLKHPGNYDAAGSGSKGPFLDNSSDNVRYSVMSYNWANGLITYPNDYMLYDIAALQYLYGARPFNPGDTAISLAYPTRFATINATDAIYDTGGVDTLSVSGALGGVKLNLNQGEFCSIGAVDNFGICYGTVLENAVGTTFADILIGNTADNTLTGGGGSDLFVFGSDWGRDTITDFTVGSDRISFERDATVTRSALDISVSAGDTVIRFGINTLTLTGVTAALPDTAFVFVI